MKGKPGGLIHDRLRRHIDRNRCGRRRKQTLKRCDAPVGDKQRLDLAAALGEEGAQDDLALGDEASLTTDEVAFADVEIAGDPRIGGIIDRNERRHGNLAYGLGRFHLILERKRRSCPSPWSS